MEQNLRRLVRRAETASVTFSEDDDFESFYRLHEQTHLRKKVSLYLPQAPFEHYFRKLHSQGLCWLFHARLPDGRAVSSELVLGGPHPVSHTVAAAFDAEYMQLGATAFLRWKAFERLSRLGYEANDLTDASLNPVTHFKSQLGGDLKTNLVLVRPDSLRYKTQATLQSTNQAGRRIIKQMLNPILNRKGR
jgi:lipid II:glycine glycyltransferase (peptidoglycan interpeptide bridge formation enzyme)